MKPRDRSRRRPGDQVGREQILRAAVASILELGFYRASTNEIARRAGMSWGSIQYYFGSRERLMLAVVAELNQQFTDSITGLNIAGDTLEERITSLYRILARQYGAPAYMARMQIVLNLQHDPDTSAEVAQILSDQASAVSDEIRRLLAGVLGPDAGHARGTALFHAIRGFVVSLQLSESVKSENAAGDEAEAVSIFLAALAAGERDRILDVE
jgi:AcrR family transcriptional regulator